MEKKTVFLTGACGGMGFQGLTRMLKDGDSYNTLVLVRDSEKKQKYVKTVYGTRQFRGCLGRP